MTSKEKLIVAVRAGKKLRAVKKEQLPEDMKAEFERQAALIKLNRLLELPCGIAEDLYKSIRTGAATPGHTN